MELIFLHIYKTGGTSIRKLLEDIYGSRYVTFLETARDHLRIRQKRKVWEIPVEEMAAKGFDVSQYIPDYSKVLMGHMKYKPLRKLLDPGEAKIFTWLRDPVDRVISQYYFRMGKLRDKPEKMKGKSELSLMEFASKKNMQNLMSRWLEGIEPEALYFIGLLEYMESDIRELGEMMGWKKLPSPYKLNTSTAIRRNFPPVGEEMRAEIRKLNVQDVGLYEKALELRGKRTLNAC